MLRDRHGDLSAAVDRAAPLDQPARQAAVRGARRSRRHDCASTRVARPLLHACSRGRSRPSEGAFTMIEFTLWDIARNLMLAARWTVLLSVIAFVGGGLTGLVLLAMRVSPLPWLRRFVVLDVEVFQGTPLLMQLFL